MPIRDFLENLINNFISYFVVTLCSCANLFTIFLVIKGFSVVSQVNGLWKLIPALICSFGILGFIFSSRIIIFIGKSSLSWVEFQNLIDINSNEDENDKE